MANVQQQQLPMGSMNDPALMVDPGYVRQMMEAQRKAKMADALLQRGMADIDYDKRGKISWTQGLAKMLDSYMGARGGLDSTSQLAQMQSDGTQRLLQMYGAGTQPSQAPQGPSNAILALDAGARQGSVGPTLQNAQTMAQMPPQQPPTPGIAGGVAPNVMNPYGLPPMLVLQAAQGNEAAKEQIKTLLENQKFTGEQKNARDPIIGGSVQGNLQTQNMTELQKLQLARRQVPNGSPQAQQLDDAISKANYIAPVDAKPGTPVLDPRSLQPRFFAPKTADGIGLDFHNPNQPQAFALPGYAGANAGIVGAEQGARSANTIGTVQDSTGANVPAWMGPVAGAGTRQLGLQGGGQGQGPVAPGARPGAAAQPFVAPRLGQGSAAQTTATASAKGAVESWRELHDFATQSAPRNIGLLQSISQLADRTLTGPGSSKLQFVNGVLNMMGVTPGGDAAQNYQVMKKNLAMLVGSQRAAAGSGGTDALQRVLEAANPDVATMNGPALKEAANELIAYQRMMISKDRVAPNPNATSPLDYAKFETKFSPFQDPRIWQMEHAESDQERTRLLSLVPQGERAGFLGKVKAARQLSLLQEVPNE